MQGQPCVTSKLPSLQRVLERPLHCITHVLRRFVKLSKVLACRMSE